MLKEASEALRRSSVQEWMSQSTLNFGMYQVTCQTEFPFRFVWAALCITREKKNVFVAMCINTSMLTFSLCDIDNDQIPQGVLLR